MERSVEGPLTISQTMPLQGLSPRTQEPMSSSFPFFSEMVKPNPDHKDSTAYSLRLAADLFVQPAIHQTPDFSQEKAHILETEKIPFKKILIISNRLPANIKTVDGKPELVATVGGLAKALHAYAKSNIEKAIKNGNGKTEGPDLRWLGWDGESNGQSEVEGLEEAFETLSADNVIKLHSIALTKEEHQAHYTRISNQGFWMLFHGKTDVAKFDLKDWEIYKKVNEKFAEKALEVGGEETFYWNQDYHDMWVAKAMRDRGSKNKIGFFLHIPFPDMGTLRHLPEKIRQEMLDGLLAHDIIGFQTENDRNNFVLAALQYLPGTSFNTLKDRIVITKDGRSATVGAFPISIDPKEIKHELENPEIHAKAKEYRDQFPNKKIMSSISRLDPTKGIIETIDALELAVTDHPELRDEIIFNLIAAPSRMDTPGYKELDAEIKQRVDQANKLSQLIQYIPGLTPSYAIAMLSVTDLLSVGSIADGMNLVAKEYAIAGPDDGVAIIGERAGAAQELGKDALVLNPTDKKAFAKAIYDGVTMPEDERRRRKAAMKKQVQEYDVVKWADTYFATAAQA